MLTADILLSQLDLVYAILVAVIMAYTYTHKRIAFYVNDNFCKA